MGSGRISNRNVREFVEEARKDGWEVAGVTNSGHIRIEHAETGATSFLPQTPSDWRSLANCRTRMRRAVQAKRSHQKAIAQ